jgi:ubiquinol-cytochrome c reductase cytochrome b/c1 subunit
MMTMRRTTSQRSSLLVALGLVLASPLLAVGPAMAAGGGTEHPPSIRWSFNGPFGTFDQAQLQRGFKVYKEVCASCHGLSKIAFRNLSQPGGPEFSTAQVDALAATYQVKDGPNEAGDMFERPARAADRIPSPFANPEQAKAAMGGAYPPDLSLITKARTYERGFPLFLLDIITQYNPGPDYVHGILRGYLPDGETPPIEVEPGLNYNKYMPGNKIAMANPLADGVVTYDDGAPATAAQYAKDVTAFLTWTAEPRLEERKQMGFRVMAFLIVFAGLLYYTKKKIWSDVEGHQPKGQAAGHAH